MEGVKLSMLAVKLKQMNYRLLPSARLTTLVPLIRAHWRAGISLSHSETIFEEHINLPA